MKTRAWPTIPVRAALRALLLLTIVAFGWSENSAQSVDSVKKQPPVDQVQPEKAPAPAINEPAAESLPAPASSEDAPAEAAKSSNSQFRIERFTLTGGAELLTVFGRLDGLGEDGKPAPEVPLVSVLRDTLGDNTPENDRLRYVWMLTYTEPSMAKRIASAIPFLYRSVGNQKTVSGPPSPIINLAHTHRATWNKFFWWGLQNAFFDTYGLPVKASSRSYRQNLSDYRKAHVAQALAILGTYQKIQTRLRDDSEFLAKRTEMDDASGQADATLDDASTSLIEYRPALTPSEMLELRARLLLSQKTFGGLYGPDHFDPTVAKYVVSSLDFSGHNWELLRQQAEADGLYFEPLTMPDGDRKSVV